MCTWAHAHKCEIKMICIEMLLFIHGIYRHLCTSIAMVILSIKTRCIMLMQYATTIYIYIIYVNLYRLSGHINEHGIMNSQLINYWIMLKSKRPHLNILNIHIHIQENRIFLFSNSCNSSYLAENISSHRPWLFWMQVIIGILCNHFAYEIGQNLIKNGFRKCKLWMNQIEMMGKINWNDENDIDAKLYTYEYR